MSVLEQVLLTIIAIAGSGWAVLWMLRAKDRGEWGFSKRKPAEPSACGTCKHFDLEAGQAVLHTHKAFLAASDDLPPWKMAIAHRKYVPNPRYLELRGQLNDELDKASEIPADHYDDRAASDKRLLAIQDEMSMQNPQQVAEPDEQTTPEMLKVQWGDMGTCDHHKECRMKSDICADFVQLRVRR